MAPGPEPPTQISIRVKVPPGYLSTADNSSGTDSFLLGTGIPVTATVGRLRVRIQQLVPTHPAPERQRLLYGGRALVDNEQHLGDAFNVKRDPSQTEYVVHLLVREEQGAGDEATAHRRAVSTPPAQTQAAGGQPQIPLPQGIPGQRGPMPMLGPQFNPHQPPFPQIIARNQQMRAGMGMQGLGGQQIQGQSQAAGQTGDDVNAGQTGEQAQYQAGQQTQQQAGQNGQAQGQTGTQPGNNGQPQHLHAPGRPISGQGFHMHGVGPNGQQFHIHQQMMQFPFGGAVPGQMPLGFPGMPQIPGMGFPQAHQGQGNGYSQQANRPSALDRARENIAEMRRALDELRNQNNASDEERQRRIGEVQQRAQSLNEYIDPLALGNANDSNAQRSGPANATAPANRTPLPTPLQQSLPPLHNALRRPTVPLPTPAQQPLHRPSNPNEVTAYLLSSPQGPQALLFSPQHGAYTGSFSQNTRPQPTPTTTVQHHNPAGHHQPDDPVAQAAHRAAQELAVQHAQLHAAQANQQAQAGQDPLGPMQALFAHFWLMVRILIFAWFLLGSDMGWQRPLLLLAVGAGYMMVRAGMLGDGAAVRRWWEGVVGLEGQGQRREGQQGQQGQHPAQGADAPVDQQPQQQGQRNAMPTPEQVAQRLLNEQADRNRQQNAWWRERIRPVERAVALFVASLWPGVGEATVRARREMEERQRAEEEVERRRREEEENARGEGQSEGVAGGEGEKRDGVGESSGFAASAPVAEGGGEGLRERRAGGEAGAEDS